MDQAPLVYWGGLQSRGAILFGFEGREIELFFFVVLHSLSATACPKEAIHAQRSMGQNGLEALIEVSAD